MDHEQRIAELETAFRKASSARSGFEWTRDQERWDLLAEATKRIDAEIAAKYGADLNRLLAAERDAKNVLQIARVEASLAADLPQGVLAEWENTPSQRWLKDHKWRRTGRRGVIEVITPESRFHANRSWGLPLPGDVIVRILKKDGTPGLAYEKWSRKPEPWEPQ